MLSWLINNKASRFVIYQSYHIVSGFVPCFLFRKLKAAKAERPREIAGVAVKMEPGLVELNASEEGVNVERLFHGRKCPASPSLHGSIRNELLSCMKPSKLQFSQTLFFTKGKQLKSRHAEFRWFKHLGISRKDNMIPSCDSSSLFVRPDLRKFTINVARVFTRKGACLTRQTSFLPSVSVKSTEKRQFCN